MNRKGIIIFIGIAVAVVIVALVILGPGRKAPAPLRANLIFWGMEPETAWRSVIQNFREKNQNITIEYKQVETGHYEEELVNALASGTGPDIFMLHNSQIKTHANKIAPLPQQALGVSLVAYKNTFADIAITDLITKDNEIIGVPLSLDTLALFYNKDMFNAANIAIPPVTWEEVTSLSRILTKVAPNGDIILSGLAMGTGVNTDHSMEILSALMMQSGAPIVRRENRDVRIGTEGREAFTFYISFARARNPNYSWHTLMPGSLEAFARDRAAMTIGFLSDIPALRKTNPHLNLGVTPFPQPEDIRTPLTFGTYTFPTVSKQSRQQQAAWQFLLFAASNEDAKHFLDATGRAPMHRTLIAAGAPSTELDVFWRQALIAKNWLIPDEAASRRLFAEAIDQVLTNATDISRALDRLAQQLQLLFQPIR